MWTSMESDCSGWYGYGRYKAKHDWHTARWDDFTSRFPSVSTICNICKSVHLTFKPLVHLSIGSVIVFFPSYLRPNNIVRLVVT